MYRNSIKLTPSAKGWEWGHLRNECRNSGLEDVYKTYRQRMQITNVSLLMLVEIILMTTHIILLLYTVEDTSILRMDFAIYVITMTANLFLLKKNFNTDLKRRRPKLVIAFNVLFVFNMVFRDIFVLYYHYFLNNNYLTVKDDFLVLIIIYLLLPLNGCLAPFLCALATTLVYDFALISLRIVNKDAFSLKPVISLNICYMGLHLMGLFDRLVFEYISRVAILTRAKFLEEQYLLKLVLAREKIMMQNILPADIASRLEQDVKQRIETGGITHNISGIMFIEPYNNVSIMTANITNFIKLTNAFSAKWLVQLLHDIFVKFDLAAEKHNVMPIKFMGDTYNCVAGIPYPNPQHAKCCINLGLEMIDVMQEVCNDYHLDTNLRIGVHSGDLHSGIIGTVKWQYDVWSKDVDIANRLEQTGRPNYVHISEKTYKLLEDQYTCEEGPQEALEDPILHKYKMVTYLVKGRRLSVKNIDMYSESAISLAPKLVKTLAYDFNHYSEEARTKALLKMEDEVHNMGIGRIELSRFFDFSDEPESCKWEDLQFSEELTPLFLIFRNRSDVWNYLKLPDQLLKYTVIIAALIGFIIIIESAANTTFRRNMHYFIILCTAIMLLCSIVVYKKLWLILIAETDDDRPTNCLSSYLYKFSEWIENSPTARIAIYYCFIGGTFAMCSVQLINCGMKEFELKRILAEIENTTPPTCFRSHVYTFSTVIVTMLLFIYPNIPLLMINCAVFIIIMTFLINVLGQYSIVFETSRSSNSGFPSEFAHCWFVLEAIIVLYITLRKRDFMQKQHYIVQRRLLQKELQVESTNNAIKMMFNNILPVHVADHYFLNKQGNKLFFQEFSNVAVMFASIKNFDPQKTGIRMLNEIICFFDSLLSKYNGKIEKIKVDNWTYLAACGLPVSLPVRQKELHFKGSALYRGSGDPEGRKPSSETGVYPKDNDDAVVLTMTQFAVDMLRIMYDILETDLLLDSMSGSECGLTIGIANGRIKAGVVGQWRTHYDIWGDSVNLAARMSSTGVLNQMQVTEETANVLQNFNIRCNSRGLTFIKGFGAINTYIVALDNNFNLLANDYSKEEEVTRISLKSVNSSEDSSSNKSGSEQEYKESRSDISFSSESNKNK